MNSLEGKTQKGFPLPTLASLVASPFQCVLGQGIKPRPSDGEQPRSRAAGHFKKINNKA